MASLDDFTRGLNRDISQLKTGVVQYYNGTTALVAVEGSLVTLNVLDSVTLSLGLVVVCSLYGRSGYVLGSLGTTVRAESAYYEGGYGNPNPPDFSTVQTTISTYSFAEAWYYDSASGGGSWNSDTDWITNNGILPASGAAGFYFYGAGAFDELSSAIAIQKIELFTTQAPSIERLVYSTTYNTKASTPVGAPTISNQTNVGFVATGGDWVSIPVATFGSLLTSGNFGIAVGRNSSTRAVSSGAGLPPYGELRVTWTS